ncbi:MAG: hypothetical protein NZ903_03005 [Candidatus Micrarchaeota archaeon]|nr:hypothetical protein [Candidatus Micrarchaeota archaeon]
MRKRLGERKDDIGLYMGVKCPNCGCTIPLLIKVYQLPNRKNCLIEVNDKKLCPTCFKKFLKGEEDG